MALRAGGKRRYNLKGRVQDGAATRDSVRLGEPSKKLMPDLRQRHRTFEEGIQKEFYPGVDFAPVPRLGGPHGIAPPANVAALPAVYGEPHGDIEKARYIGQAQKLAEGMGGRLDASVTDDMIRDVQQREDEAKVAEYHGWLHEKFDYRQPGVAALLQKFEPEFIQSRVDLIKRDLGVEMMDKIINEFGVQSGEDARYLFARERGMIRTQEEVGGMRQHAPDMFTEIPGDGGMYIPGPLFSIFRPPFFRRAADAQGNPGDAEYNYNDHRYPLAAYSTPQGFAIPPGGRASNSWLQPGAMGLQPTDDVPGVVNQWSRNVAMFPPAARTQGPRHQQRRPTDPAWVRWTRDEQDDWRRAREGPFKAGSRGGDDPLGPSYSRDVPDDAAGNYMW